MIKLKKFKIGRVVFWKKSLDNYGVGHVVGFGTNCFGEICIKIKPADKYVLNTDETLSNNVEQEIKLMHPERLTFDAI